VSKKVAKKSAPKKSSKKAPTKKVTKKPIKKAKSPIKVQRKLNKGIKKSADVKSTKPKQMVKFANLSQSMHVGLNDYDKLKNELFRSLNESYNDNDRYAEFFKNKLHYHRIFQITDESKFNLINLRGKIL